MPYALHVVATAIVSGVLYAVFVQSLSHVSKDGRTDELLWFFNGFSWDAARSGFTVLAVGVAIVAYLAAWLGYGWACAAVGGRALPEALKADSRTFILSFSVAFVLGVRCNVDRPKFFHTIAAFYVAFIAWKLIYFLRGLLKREGVPSAGQVFAIFLATYAAVNVLHSRTRPMGDEPHYLVMAHSLVHDGDLELSNNYASRDYRRFFDQDEIHWHGRPRELPDGRKVVYSWHDAGLAILIAPGYAFSPRFWPLFILNIACAALMTTVLLLLKDLGLGGRDRLYATLAFGLTPPIVFYANQVFPEVPAAFLLILGLRQVLLLPDKSVRRCLIIGLCICLLPWLGRRFGLLCICLFAMGLLRMRHSVGSWVALCLPNVLSALVMRQFFIATYGAFTATAGWWDLLSGSWYYIKPHAVLGLLFDREAGLLTFAPIYVFAVAGFWILMGRDGRRAAMLLAVFC
ncbi:MAG: hypothetical protein FJ279_32280, partial [Planctomycetes bacterium]|nr:hypothetical protein [Planctomycetota bacterium]